ETCAVEESSADHLPSTTAQTETISQKIREIREGLRPVGFSHVTEAAQAFLVAALAKEIRRNLWVFCSGVRAQELRYESLLNWQPDALFLPEAELAAVENVLPDPEIAAERLALLTEIERDSRPRIVVATRASLDQSAPKRGTLQSAVTQLTRGAAAKMEQLVEQLVGNGYERGAQVTTRG